MGCSGICLLNLNIPIIIGIQFYLADLDDLLPAILDGDRDYIPQMFLDIFITSLIFVALLKAYRRPLWHKTEWPAIRATRMAEAHNEGVS